MLFNSLSFLIFFATVLALFRIVPSWRGKKLVLLAASYVFYAAWNPSYVVILAFSTVLDWWLARQIGASRRPQARKALLVVSLVANLGLLGFFKYGDFVLSNIQHVFGWVAVPWNAPVWNIVLPVGISFYTFASLSYTIDVFRGEVKSDIPLTDYALFVAFFPHLVAGPIVRARTLLPQLAEPRVATVDQISYGLVLVAIGLLSKAVLADHLFAPVVDAVYASQATQGTVGALAAIFGFAAQIYFDFGGYSLCAIGLAMCFGFAFPDNFRYPYGACGFSDFWRRWHISLSTWLRDYLYIPLGGNRNGELATHRNLMLTMLLGGLWHGASWMFVIWGALHGAFLITERSILKRWSNVLSPKIAPLGITITFLCVSLAWIPFRAADFQEVRGILTALVRFRPYDAREWITLLGALGMFAWQWRMRHRTLDEVLGGLGYTARAGAVAASLIGIFLVSGGDERAFIYFQF